MNTRLVRFQAAVRRWGQANGDDALFFVPLFAVFCTLEAVFDGDSLSEIILTAFSSLVLGSVVGMQLLRAKRQPLEHELSHVRLAILVNIIMWTIFVIGLALAGWIKGITDGRFWEQVVVLITVGQLFMMLLGAIWGTSIRALDWYPLRRTRSSVIRLIGLYLLALALLIGCTALATVIPQWLTLLAAAGFILVWLAVARLWRG